MKYPKFLNKKSSIGICAPSSGVGDKIADYEKSINYLKNEFNIIETPSVRNNSIASNTKEIRAEEFNSLLHNDDINMILIARGGEFCTEVLPLIDFDSIINHPKWIMGYSDPTCILFNLTTKYDIATIYGFNSTSYDVYDNCLLDNINIIKGNKVVEKYSNIDNSWFSNKSNIEVSGRIIGGCTEVLDVVGGTCYEDVENFNEKYQLDGVIWYFDIYSYSATDFYRLLLRFKYMDWFKNVVCVMVGKINNWNEDYMTYEDAVSKVFGDIPFICNIPLGHTFPKVTIINGSICNLKYSDNNLELEFDLK